MAGFKKTGAAYQHAVHRALCFSALPLLTAPFANAEEQFNTSFIHGENNVTLVHSLASGDDILPGKYPLDIYLNKTRVDRREIEFKKDKPGTPGYFCLSAEDYRTYGILVPETQGSSACYDIVKNIAGSQISWNAGMQELDLSVPQSSMEPQPHGAISPRLFDDGINAAFVNYSFSGDHSRYTDSNATQNSDYYFLSLKNGMNIGAWRFRNTSSLSKSSGSKQEWKSIANLSLIHI